jgi:hypothetical protein
MKRLLFIFNVLLFFVILPLPALAELTDDLSSAPAEAVGARAEFCKPTSYECECGTDGGTNSFPSTAEECDIYCSRSTATSYTLRCELEDETKNYTVAQGSVTTVSDLTEAPEQKEKDYLVPTLLVPIPGFSNSSNENNDFSIPTKAADGSQTSVNFLAEYINAVYGWILGAAALVAVVMMMIGGLQYTLSRGKPKYIEKAKTRITNAITGMVLLLAAFNIAYLIDPRLTDLEEIGVTNVEGIEYFPPDGEDTNVTPNVTLSGTTVPITGAHITAGCQEGCAIDADVLSALQTAATSFHSVTGKNVVIASATRSLSKQAALFYNNCILTGGVCSPATCNASSGVVTKSGSRWKLTGSYANETSGTAIVAALSNPANAAYGNCPHTSGIALDAWCDDGGSNYRHDPACQGQLITAMVNAGFCRLSSEAWHFELETKKVSTACLTSNTSISYTKKGGTQVTPTSDCAKWNFKLHTCAIKKQ